MSLKAPVSGQLTSRNAEIGESKTKGERLGQIDVLDGFKLLITVDEYYLSRISIGQKGTFNFDGKVHELRVSKVYPEVLNGRFEVDMEFINEEPEGIRRGQSQHIRLELVILVKDYVIGTRWIFSKNRWTMGLFS